jgi:hypothetical protein
MAGKKQGRFKWFLHALAKNDHTFRNAYKYFFRFSFFLLLSVSFFAFSFLLQFRVVSFPSCSASDLCIARSLPPLKNKGKTNVTSISFWPEKISLDQDSLIPVSAF